MPLWSKIAVGLVLAASLLGFAGLKAYTGKRTPVVQSYGTTYYGTDGPQTLPASCKTEGRIREAISSVNASFDLLSGDRLRAFEDRATRLQGLPPLRVDTLYVITEDDLMRHGETVLFIGITSNCVSTVFSFPARLYRELAADSGNA